MTFNIGDRVRVKDDAHPMIGGSYATVVDLDLYGLVDIEVGGLRYFIMADMLELATVAAAWYFGPAKQVVTAGEQLTINIKPPVCAWCSEPGKHAKCERYLEAAKARAEAGYYYGTEAERESVMRWVDGR